MLRILGGLGLAAAATLAHAATPVGPAPAARAEAVSDTIQGVVVADPYRWLEDDRDPAVKAWSDAQNLRARGYLDAAPGRAAVQARLIELTKAASPSTYDLRASATRLFGLYNDPAFQQPQLIVMGLDADPAARKVVVNPNALNASGALAIDWFVPSPDGSKVAVSMSLGGSEDGSLHIFDVATGRELEPIIPRVQYPTGGGAVAWTPAGDGFWYTRYPDETAPEADRHFFQQAYFHKLGSDWKTDALVLGTRDGVPRTAEIFLDNRNAANAALASVQLGDGGEWQHWILKPGAPAQKVGAYADKVVSAALGVDGTIYGVSHLNAPNGKIVKLAAPYTGGLAKAQTIVPEGKTAIVVDSYQRSLTVAQRLFVTTIDGGPSALTSYRLDGSGARSLPAPAVSSIDAVEALPGGEVLYEVSEYLRPSHTLRWGPASDKASETKIADVSPIDYSDVEVVREFATSKDGAKVPLNIIRRKGIKLDGSNPTLLYGYGGYGINMTPSFLPGSRRLWLDAGGVYVVANLRGGAEYGEAWHRGGALTNKQNVFDDFYAAGRYLTQAGYATPAKLALQGGSNGGLLMGATLTQHPDLARAVVSQVGIYDMVRSELDPNGAFNITEFGTVKDPAQFKAMYAYSPYHHVRAGAPYPALLLMTGANDGRVNPLHSRKFAAALQAAGSGGPILLRTSDTSGHGRGSSQDDRLQEATDILMFLIDQLGATPPAN